MFSMVDLIRKWIFYLAIFAIFVSSTLFLMNHFHIYREYGKIEDFTNSAVSIAQKNGGFYTMTTGENVDVMQKQRLSFKNWAEYNLSTIHDVKTNLEIILTANGSSTTGVFDAKSGTFIKPFDSSSAVLTKRVQRGDEFSIEVKPYYVKWNMLPIKTSTIEGRSVIKVGRAHAYIKVID